MKPSQTAWVRRHVALTALLALTATIPAFASEPEEVVVSFNGTSGNLVSGLSIDAAGNLWGVTLVGGAGSCGGAQPGCGTVFELTPAGSGWTTKVIYKFQGGHDGAFPSGTLLFDAAGNIYGETSSGGSACDCGTAYELTPNSGRYEETVIYRFDDTVSHSDGEAPIGGLVMDSAGNLYGTTSSGGNGCAFNCGTVFELSPANGAWNESILHNFAGGTLDGSYPSAALVFDAQGNLYGTTYAGGTGSCSGSSGCGVVFELSPTEGGWSESILYNFAGGANDGARSYSNLIFDPTGNIYGTTYEGGNPACDLGCGAVFEISPADGTWAETAIHLFAKNDGHYLNSGLVMDASGNLYGVTAGGGVYDSGAAFQLTKDPEGAWAEKILHSFGNNKDGVQPNTALVFDATGTLFGGTVAGGAFDPAICDSGSGCGVVFQLTP